MLATASIGAIWASCGPDFGARGVLDRFAQLGPKVFFCATRYRHGGRVFSRISTMRGVIEGLTSLQHVIHVAQPRRKSGGGRGARRTLVGRHHEPAAGRRPAQFRFEQVAFDHPLWILFTSGTTGLPKPIVHGHGGILLEQLKHLSFNFDLRTAPAACSSTRQPAG